MLGISGIDKKVLAFWRWKMMFWVSGFFLAVWLDNGHYGGTWTLFLQDRLSYRWKQQLISALKNYKTARCQELQDRNLFLISHNQPDRRHIHFVPCHYTECYFFGSNEHRNFHLPGYRVTTAVLGTATEETHCSFWSHNFTYLCTKVSFVMNAFSQQK